MSILTVRGADESYENLQYLMRKCRNYVQRIDLIMKYESHCLPVLTDAHVPRKWDRFCKVYRAEGLVRYRRRRYYQALKFFTASLAYAESIKDISMIYADRSGAFQKLGLDKYSLLDMRRAFETRYPNQPSSQVNKVLRETILLPQPIPPETSAQQDCDTVWTSDCFEVAEDEKYGRHLVATRDIAVGEILLNEQPFASVLITDKTTYCTHCMSLSYGLIPCDLCPDMYCSQKCKNEAFEAYHKYECQIASYLVRQPHFENPDEIIIALRATLRSLKGAPCRYQPTLVNRPAGLQFDVAWMACIVFSLLQTKTTYFMEIEDSEACFKEMFSRIFQDVLTSSVMITRLDPTVSLHRTESYAKGLYPMYSMFNHSCYPNVFHYYEGPTLTVRAMASINKGEQLFVAYSHCLYDLTPNYIRHDFLVTHYYFTCTCVPCTENWAQDPRSSDFYENEFMVIVMAKMEGDVAALRTLIRKFISKIRRLENAAPMNSLESARQLFQKCFEYIEVPSAHGKVKPVRVSRIQVKTSNREISSRRDVRHSLST